MKKECLLLVLFFCINLNQVSAQCPPPGFPLPGDNCAQAPVLCQNIDGYCTTINNNNQVQTFPGCPGNVLNNDEWFAFFAGTPTITLQITPTNCQGPPGQMGLQAALYDGCQGNALATQCNCTSAPFLLSSNSFVVGQIYWVVIDGCAGDVCDYTVNVLAGSTVPTPPAMPGPIEGVTEVCPGSILPYSLNPVMGATQYDWTIVPAIGSVSSNDNMATVNWTLPGTAQLCVTVSNPCISNPVPSCITVNSVPIPPTDEEADLCLGKSTICAGQIFFTPGVFPVTLSSYLGCDSIINCIITPIPPLTTDLGQIDLCGPNTYEICNNFINQSGIYSYDCQSYQGCDSTVIVDLAVMDPIANIAEPVPEIGCGGNAIITLDGTGSNFNLVPNGNTTYNWTGPGIVGLNNDVIVTVDQAGLYCLELTHERNGVSCIDTYCVDVLEDIETPDAPILDGLTEVCDGDMETYTVTPVGSVTPNGYTWTSPNGEPINDISNTSVSIDWTGSIGGELCVTADNDCGSSEPTCLTITVSTGPEDPILDGANNACDGAIQTYTITNPTSDATCSWTVPPGASFTDNGTSIDVDFSGASTGDVCVTCTNDCGTTMEVCLTVIITPIPDVPIISTGLTEVCDGSTETYCVDPDPNAIDYTWETPTGIIPNTGDCIDIDWSGLSDGSVCVTANNDCGSSQQTCIQITLNESPSATLSGGGDFCVSSGDTIQLDVELTGLAPWNLVYTNGTDTTSVADIMTSPFLINATTPGDYTLISVDDASICSGIISGNAQVIENELPTVALSGSGSICAGSGETVDLIIDLTGANDWIVNWTVNGDDQAPLNISSSPFTLTIGQSQAGDVELTGVSDANGCTNVGDGNVINITVNDEPAISNILTTCNGTNTGYILTFEINGGDPATYSVISNVLGVSGTITNTAPYIFTSDLILNGDGYSFVVNDGNNCNPVTIEDDAVLCDCTTSVGSMDLGLIEQCGDDVVTANYDNTNEVLDADDTLEYILHEGNGPNIVNVIATNTTPTFGFQSGMTYSETYYISAIAGNDLGGGSVDQDDPCLAVAQGTPVIFYETPTAFMFGNVAICEGESTGLSIELTGVGPWSLQYDDGTDINQINGINVNPFILNVTPTNTTTYTLISVNDDNCPGEVGGDITVTVNTAVQVTNLMTNCNATSTAYTITFEISGGDPSSYEVIGVNGTISTTAPYIFTSEDIITGIGFNISVDDDDSCDPQTVTQNIVVCDCVTEIGEMDLIPIDECGDGPVLATYDNTNQATDADDIVQFVLHTGNLNLGTIIQTNDTEPSFSFDPLTMDYGTTYYISAMAGNNDGSGNVDPSEPCFAFAQGTPITFFEIPSGILSGAIEICENGDANLTVNLTGDSPWTIVINGESISDIVSTPFIYNVTPSSTDTYVLETVNDQNCPGNVSGDALVVVNAAPTVSNVAIECNPTNTAYTVTFDIEGGDNTCYTINGNPGTLTGSTFISDEIPTGSGYLFQVNDCKDCGPVVIEEPMIICDCETMAGEMDGIDASICGNGPVVATYTGGEVLDANDALCFILHEGDPNAPLANNSTEPSFQFQPAIMNYGQPYFICAVAGNDNGNGCVALNDPCRNISTTCTEVIFYEIPSAALTGDAIICAGESVDLTVSFSGGSAPYTLSYEDAFTTEIQTITTMDNPYTLSVTPTGSTVFNLLTLEDANCLGSATGSFPVTVNPAPTISNIGTFCNDTSTGYVVTFTINSSSPDITVNPPSSGTITATAPYIFTSNEIDATQGYAFEIDNVNGCGPVFESDGPPTCECITDAGAMINDIVDACEIDAITAFHEGDEVLDADDVLGFMLHTLDGGAFVDALATNSIPSFAFDPAIMAPEVTYYICPIAGNDLGNGSPDPADECFNVGPCVPVFWFALPTVNITGSTTICEGESTDVTFAMTGVGPYNIEYTIDGDPQTITVFGQDTSLTVSPAVVTQFGLVGISDITSGCSNTASGSITIDVSTPVNAGSSTGDLPFCADEDQTVDLNTLLTGADPGGIWTDELGNTVSNTFTTLGKPDGEYIFTYTLDAQAPCSDDFAQVKIIIRPLPIADAGTNQTLNCDMTIGSLGGENTSQGNYTYSWSGGSPTDPNEAITTTSTAGVYTLLVVDNETGCSATDEIEIMVDLSAPQPTLNFSDLSCFEANDGFISLDPILGGSPPYLCSIDGGPFSNETTFNNLSAGMHIIICRDSKGCEVEIPVEITQPNQLGVEIMGDFNNDDQLVDLGDSVRITVQVNLPFDSLDAVIWTPAEAIPCDTCPNFYITPDEQMMLTITVQEGKCSATDDLTILVRKNRPIYVPNGFSPNGDNNNDKLIVYGGNSVAKVKKFVVFNRWGESVWEYKDFLPNDPASGWDGYYRGDLLNPAVFVWFAEVEFIDGIVEVFEGDVTLVR
jgi:gliding motility-associated-like protein